MRKLIEHTLQHIHFKVSY